MDQRNLILNCVSHVYKSLGFGQSECVYRTALKYEFLEQGFKVQEEFIVPITYTTEKGTKYQVGTYRLDLILNNSIILELKTLSKDLTKDSKEYNQLLRYTRVLPCTGYLVNFCKTGVQVI